MKLARRLLVVARGSLQIVENRLRRKGKTDAADSVKMAREILEVIKL